MTGTIQLSNPFERADESFECTSADIIGVTVFARQYLPLKSSSRS
jgi:hypothetical protein